MTVEKIAVIGAGSWGTTLADLLACKGYGVTLWAREPEVVAQITEKGENRAFLPGVKLSEKLVAVASLKEALKESKFIVSVVPSHGVRGVFEEAVGFISNDAIVVTATKGIEEGTLLTPSSILKEVLSGKVEIAALSGPSFAKEVSKKLPTAVSVASASEGAMKRAQETFSTPYFRVYTNKDIAGVELGGALKNVIAIASGISDGLGLGYNARAALITRGLAETARLGAAMGADPATFSGLSGLGDLVLTCTAPLSRNYTVGFKIGGGMKHREVVEGMKMVAEGVKTTAAARALSLEKGIDMPITEAVYSILYEDKPPEEAVYELMTRGLKGE
ncbi:MAG: NAD(P)H-dependent glycerol-3-phosphate dehydrogenase [Thermodesulfobacteriota bacterium]|nr:MAG: NAD(P)H-dependent glycerol-3-phosphate dehydrogenase [Thermodesulfobacteriota bacterium]